MKIGLISDTHSYIDDRILSFLDKSDEIWHAGDIGDLMVTDKLAQIAPLRVVFGNIDNHQIRSEFDENLNFEIQNKKIFMTHIGGKPSRYAKGVKQNLMSAKPDVFICGHSHICKVEMDRELNCLYMNPGAAGIHGFHRVRTLLRFEINDSIIHNLEVVELGKRGKNLTT